MSSRCSADSSLGTRPRKHALARSPRLADSTLTTHTKNAAISKTECADVKEELCIKGLPIPSQRRRRPCIRRRAHRRRCHDSHCHRCKRCNP